MIRKPAIETFWAALATVAAIACAAPPAARAGAYVRLSDIAARFGLSTEVDLLTGRYVLSDGQNRVAVVSGGYQMLVNGRFATLPDRVGSDRGDLIVPAEAMPFIERHLVRGPAPAEPVAAAARPGAIPEPRPAAAPRVAPGGAGTIVVDPGHGGAHTGARGGSGLLEKEVNLAIALDLKEVLEARGFRVVLTRSGDRHFDQDVNGDLDARVAIAGRSGADLFLSIHANYAETPSARGFEVYCAPGRPRDAALARAIVASLRASIDDEDRGVKTAGFRVVKRTSIPSVLVEVGFVSHPATARRLATAEYRRRIAEAIAGGVERFATNGQ